MHRDPKKCRANLELSSHGTPITDLDSAPDSSDKTTENWLPPFEPGGDSGPKKRKKEERDVGSSSSTVGARKSSS